MMSLTLSQHCILDADEAVCGEAAVCCWSSFGVQHIPAWLSEYNVLLVERSELLPACEPAMHV